MRGGWCKAWIDREGRDRKPVAYQTVVLIPMNDILLVKLNKGIRKRVTYRDQDPIPSFSNICIGHKNMINK